MGAGTGHSVSMSEVVYIAGCRAWLVVKYLGVGVAGELVTGYLVQEGSGRNPGLLGGGS
jgi:hypothetical protein